MHHIPTSPAAVSKLKKAAKLLVRDQANLSHTDALDLVATNAGYAHWKHVTTCASGSHLHPPVAPGMPNPSGQSLTFLVGVSGSGKTRRASDMARYWLQHTKPVHIIDCGSSYLQLSQLAGGTFVTFSSDSARTDHRHGEAPLCVFELGLIDPLPHSPHSPYPTYPTLLPLPLAEINPAALLIIDEHPYVASLLGGHPNLARLVSHHMDSGGSAVIVTQEAPSNAYMRSYLPKVRKTDINLLLQVASF